MQARVNTMAGSRRFQAAGAISLTLMIAGISLTGLAMRARSWSASSKSAAGGSPAQAPSPVKAVLIAVTPQGFRPNEVNLPGGRYIIAVDNRSKLPELSLLLDRVGW